MSPIWFAANHGDLGGGEVMTLNLARAARDLGYDARLVVPARPARLLDLGRTEGFRTVELHGSTPVQVAANLAAWDLAERRGLLWTNGLRTAAATIGHLDRVVHLHQVPRGRQSWIVRAATLGARAVVVPSAYAAAAVPGSVCLPNWTHPVDTAQSGRPPLRDRTGPITLGHLGRLSIHKGLDVLAAALARLDDRHPGRFRIVVAGEPTYADAADRAAVDAALRAVAPLVTRVGQQSPAAFFAGVDLAVFASVIPESFGLVVAEAMSAGCPFVVSDAGALPEVAGDHPYVASAGDPVSLADTIEAAIASYDDRLLRDAYDRWQASYSPAAGRAGLSALLRELGVER